MFLSVLDGAEGLCFEIAHNEQQLRFSIEEGQRFALHAGAHGKAILAFLPAELREAACAGADARGASADCATLDAQLARTHQDGWAHTREESASTVAGLGGLCGQRIARRSPARPPSQDPIQRLDEAAVPRLLDAL